MEEHDFPDVVLEVDHTTNVRSGKLWFYEEWGFPEVWVEVPERESPSRPAGRRPGLTIHLLEGGAYGTARESRAFPGWTANEIHIALNEPVRSAVTSRFLDRVGRALGARDGTGPDDTLWLRAHREEGHARGWAEGQAAGRAEGRIEGWAEARAEIVAAFRHQLLASRGVPASRTLLGADRTHAALTAARRLAALPPPHRAGARLPRRPSAAGNRNARSTPNGFIRAGESLPQTGSRRVPFRGSDPHQPDSVGADAVLVLGA